MSEEIFLKRPHAGVPWGFRIIGGSDSHLPIIVSKVLEGSIAQGAGLEEDILLERINNIPTSGLSHSEVDQVILSAENELLFTVRREKLENLILASLSDFEDDSEITTILRQAVNQNKIVEEQEEEENGISAEEADNMNIKREFGEIMMMGNNEINNDAQLKQNLYGKPSMERALIDRKWSTFLQKPKNLPPKSKTEATLPKSKQYRVIIKKQKKKEEKTKEETIKDQQIIQPEIIQQTEELETEQKLCSVPEPEELVKENIYEAEVRLETLLNETESNIEEYSTEEAQNDAAESAAAEGDHEMIIETLETDLGEVNQEIEEKEEHVPTLEEQLAAVQQQLRQLAELPSSVQESLTMVTQQLASIVGEHKPQADENEEGNAAEEFEGEVNQTELDENDNLGNVEEAIIRDPENEEGGEVTENAEMENSNSEVLSDISEEQDLSEAMDENQNIIAADDDAEHRRIEEERLMKQQLIEEEEQRKKPIVRPIILPGGRKWVDPDDAVLKVKNPKMTDDKICDTINTFSEVIVGRTKGINFLKYTPPPKNLDYLQKSDVYRLIHGMEPPVKGISVRSEMIMAEEDYYSGGEA